MPLVGEDGRSVALARRACEDDIVNVRPRPGWSPSATEFVLSDIGDALSCASSAATSEFKSGLLLVEVRSVENLLVE